MIAGMKGGVGVGAFKGRLKERREMRRRAHTLQSVKLTLHASMARAQESDDKGWSRSTSKEAPKAEHRRHQPTSTLHTHRL
jgi:hypothetical protein